MISLDWHNFIKTLKKATVYLVALFIIVFALADVSVLQAYHGNEAIGILAEHHLNQENDCDDEKTQTNSDQKQQASISQHGDQHDSDGDCSGEGECLSGCSHIILGYFVFHPSIFTETKLMQNPLSREKTIPNSESTSLFRPPQTA